MELQSIFYWRWQWEGFAVIDFILGKPGAGKGILAMHKILEELRTGDRCIVTDLAVRMNPWNRKIRKNGRVRNMPQQGLLGYLVETYGTTFKAESRLHVLDEKHSHEFYLWRVVNGKLVDMPANRDVRTNAVQEFDPSIALETGGVLYVTDEAWSILGARNWQNTGKGVLFYAAQHRKLGDDWLVVTQHSKQIDTAVRQVAQSYWVVRNHSKLKLGFFKHPDIFTASIYEQPPDKSSQPMERRSFRLDKAGVGSCFDTAAGKGVKGGAAADIGHKTKGLPWWTVILVVAGIACAWYAFTQYLAKKNHQRMLDISKPSEKQQTERKQNGEAHEKTNTGTNVATLQQFNNTNQITCDGYMLTGGTPKVFLSTGDTVTPTNYFRKGPNSVEMDGHTYPLTKPPVGMPDMGGNGIRLWGGNITERPEPKVEVTVIGRREDAGTRQPEMRYNQNQ